MKLQPITRAAACAVAVIVCLAGAGWFTTQPAAGQEIKQQVYRPGLRNSSMGRRLSAKEMDLTLAQLRSKTGFTRLELRDPSAEVNEAGDCESYVNRIRRELGMPERRQYGARVYERQASVSGPTTGTAELIFARTEPGAKTKSLYLKWDVREVGNTRRRQR